MPQRNNTLPSADSGKELPLHLQHWEPWLQSVLLEYPDLSEQDRHDITHRIADFERQWAASQSVKMQMLQVLAARSARFEHGECG